MLSCADIVNSHKELAQQRGHALTFYVWNSYPILLALLHLKPRAWTNRQHCCMNTFWLLLPMTRCLIQAKGKKMRAGKDMDMEVTFTPGLEGLGARLLAQRKEASQRKGDTVWEAYLRRQK